MNTTKTDRANAIEADEFLWDTCGTSEVHRYVLPVVDGWLRDCDAGEVLDIGCGNGAFTAVIAGLGMHCVGTDSSESGIRLAKQQYPEIEFFRSSIEQPLPAEHQGRYDTVLATEVIEHLLLPRCLFARAKEALRPGGTLVISTPFHGFWKNLGLAMLNRFDEHWHPLRDYGHVKFFSDSTLCRLFEEQGFRIAGKRRVGRIPAFARSILVRGTYAE